MIFPANSDVGAATADIGKDAANKAWENGIFFSNGNYAMRHFGIPSITVAMGTMDDIGMPVGLTFAGPTYADNVILGWGWAFEYAGTLRTAPRLAPSLVSDAVWRRGVASEAENTSREINISVGTVVRAGNEGAGLVELSGEIHAPAESGAVLTVNGETVPVQRAGPIWTASTVLPAVAVLSAIGLNPVAGSFAVIQVVTPNGLAAGAIAEF